MLKNLSTIITVVVLAASTHAEDWGTVSGKIVLDGDAPKPRLIIRGVLGGVPPANIFDESLLVDPKTKGIANCFVYLRKTPERVNDQGVDKEATVPVEIKDLTFTPRAMIVRAGQPIEVFNSDPVDGFVRVDGRHVAENLKIKANTAKGNGPKIETKSKEIIPALVNSDVHVWMRAYWLVTDHPYAAVTDEKGEFTIRNLPVGKHEFRVWHERFGFIERKWEVEIAEGTRNTVTLKVDSKRFQE